MNYRLFEALNDRAGRVDLLDDAMEFAATRLIYALFLAVAVLVAVALHRHRVRPVLYIGAAAALAFAIASVLEHLSVEVRPFQTHQVHQLIPHRYGASLPSDHATAAFTLALAVAVFLHRRWGVVLGVAAVLIGVSRVWVGVHYPGDILAAAVIAVLAVLQVALAERCWHTWRQEALSR